MLKHLGESQAEEGFIEVANETGLTLRGSLRSVAVEIPHHGEYLLRDHIMLEQDYRHNAPLHFRLNLEGHSLSLDEVSVRRPYVKGYSLGPHAIVLQVEHLPRKRILFSSELLVRNDTLLPVLLLTGSVVTRLEPGQETGVGVL